MITERDFYAKADAIEKEGSAIASVLEKKALAEARGQEARAVALEKEGAAEANVMAKKYEAEALGIEQKADAMKKFDGVGKEHEEFKLKLEKEKEIELTGIRIQKDIAEAQASIINEGLKSATIDIVGGDTMFFDKIVNSITQGKAMDRMVDHSHVLTDVKDTFFTGDADEFAENLRGFIDKFNMSSDDLKNLTISGLILKLMNKAGDDEDQYLLNQIKDFVVEKGLGDTPARVIQS